MPNIYHILFELLIYLQFALCLAHASRHGASHVIKLFSAAVFGFLLELLTIRQLNAHHYGQFLLMIADVPLCIALAWGSIIYSVMEFSHATGLPRWARPLLDGLLAVNIDLALDAVAIRLGFWDWGRLPGFQYFGVPYANFLAWFWVASSFSAGYRLLAQRREGRWALLGGPLGIVFGLAVVLATNAFMAYVIPLYFHVHIVLVVLGMAFVLVYSLQPRLPHRPVAAVAFWVPFLTMAYVIVAGFFSGILLKSPELLPMILGMLAVLLALHWARVRQAFMRKTRGGPRLSGVPPA